METLAENDAQAATEPNSAAVNDAEVKPESRSEHE
jgi:hypothetical protein